MKHILIGLDAGSPSQRNEITAFLSDKEWAYWHWLDDVWIVQVPNEYTPKTLHNEIEDATNIGKPTMLVFEFKENITYWGRNKKEAWKWLAYIGESG